MEQTVYIQFDGAFSPKEKMQIANYIQIAPSGFWCSRVSVYKEDKTGLITIKDHKTEHKIYEHEVKQES